MQIPGNAEIYIQQFRELVDFEIFQPDVFLPLINKKWSVQYFVGFSKAQVQGNLAATGVTSGNILFNLQTYIMLLCIFLFFMLILVALMIIKKFRAKIKALITSILQKTFFNNSVRSINLSYLKSALAFVIAVQVFNEDNKNKRETAAGIAVYFPIIILGAIPFICWGALYKYRDRL